jgi:hypothetical protein
LTIARTEQPLRQRAVMEPPDASCVSRAAMSRACVRTTGRRIHIRLCGDESESSNASSQPAQLSASFPHMLRFTTPSTFNATSSPAARFGSSGQRRSKLGGWRPLRPERARHPDPCDLAPVAVTVPRRRRLGSAAAREAGDPNATAGGAAIATLDPGVRATLALAPERLPQHPFPFHHNRLPQRLSTSIKAV